MLLAISLLAPSIARAAPRPGLIGVGNVPGCHDGLGNPASRLHAYGARVFRVIVNYAYFGTDDRCIAMARAAGAKLELVIQYRNTWSTAQDRAWFTKVLSHYPRASYVAVGNEQELAVQGGHGQSGHQYSATWKAVKPIIHRYAPAARLIAGEGSPWSIKFLQQALHAGLPGAQILAAHAYHLAHGSQIRDFLVLGRQWHLPVWLDEGLAGPHAWPGGSKGFTRQEARGAQMAAVWLRS